MESTLVDEAIDLINDPAIIYYPFRGEVLATTFMVAYIINKHRNVCIPLGSVVKQKGIIPIFIGGIEWTCRFPGREGQFGIEGSYDLLLKCLNHPDPKYRFVVLSLGLAWITPCETQIAGAGYVDYPGAHANILIIDRETHEVERFEPHGTMFTYYEWEKLDEKLTNFFNSLGYKYIPPLAFCPTQGFQVYQAIEEEENLPIDPEGYCAAWSIWWLDLRLTYPNINREDLTKYALEILTRKQAERSFTEFIRSYTAYLVQWRLNLFESLLTDLDQNVVWFTQGTPPKRVSLIFKEFDPDDLEDPNKYWVMKQADGSIVFVWLELEDDQLIIHKPTEDITMNINEIPEATIGYINFDTFYDALMDYMTSTWKQRFGSGTIEVTE